MRLQPSLILLASSCVAIWAGVARGDAVIEAGKDNPAYKAKLYRPATSTATEPIRLRPGPQLFVDDYLVGKSVDVKRRVNCPVRDRKGPIITAKEDLNHQPYMSIIRNPETKRLRIWYGVFGPHRESHLATMESDDGIHWQRPTQVLKDPGPINFGSSVIDEGPDFPDRSARYKFAYWNGGGLKIAVSSDGLKWKLLRPNPVLRHNHDITNLFYDTLRKRYAATISVTSPEPTWTADRCHRWTMQSTSRDLIHWEKPWYILTSDDPSDPPETQFYAMSGHLIRGDLWIGLVKILHDNWQAKGTPKGSYGVGSTQLAWTRDGQTWYRDQTPYFEPDPKVGAWDHAHAWMDFQLPIGDETYIYYGGYKNGHKVNRYEERQIGLVRIPRDRYVSRDAGPDGGTLTTPPVILEGKKLTVNAHVRGEMRVRLLDTAGKPLPGFDFGDCQPIRGDGIALPVEWPGTLEAVKDKPVRIEFQMKDSQLYAFDLE
jgi:hypothetical protein